MFISGEKRIGEAEGEGKGEEEKEMGMTSRLALLD